MAAALLNGLRYLFIGLRDGMSGPIHVHQLDKKQQEQQNQGANSSTDNFCGDASNQRLSVLAQRRAARGHAPRRAERFAHFILTR